MYYYDLPRYGPLADFFVCPVEKLGKHLNVHDALFDLHAPFVVLKVDMAMVDPFLLAQIFFCNKTCSSPNESHNFFPIILQHAPDSFCLMAEGDGVDIGRLHTSSMRNTPERKESSKQSTCDCTHLIQVSKWCRKNLK